MQAAKVFRFGTFGLVACLLTQTATANWFDQLFRPAAFEELVAPANEIPDTELPPPPEPLPPSAGEKSVLAPPLPTDASPSSPSDQAPHDAELHTYETAPFPSHQNDGWPVESWSFPTDPHLRGGLDEGNDHSLRHDHHLTALDHQACCEPPKIKYWNHPLLANEICSCHNQHEITVLLTVPTDCCSVEVPVCLTACCDSVPECQTGRDLLGRTTHEYCWPCGQRVKIVERHTGTLMVHTYQRD